MHPLQTHAQLLKDTPGRGVASEMPAFDAVEAEFSEAIPNDGSRCLGRKAVSPVRHPNPIADLSVPVRQRQAKVDRPHKLARWSCCADGKREVLAALPRVGVRRDPLRAAPGWIRMRNRQCGIGDLTRTGELLNTGCVRSPEWSEQ